MVVGKPLSNAWVYLAGYVLFSLVWTCVLTHQEYGGEWVWDARHH